MNVVRIYLTKIMQNFTLIFEISATIANDWQVRSETFESWNFKVLVFFFGSNNVYLVISKIYKRPHFDISPSERLLNTIHDKFVSRFEIDSSSGFPSNHEIHSQFSYSNSNIQKSSSGSNYFSQLRNDGRAPMKF